MIKIFLVDDSSTFLEGLVSYFRHLEEVAIIGIAKSGKECLEKIQYTETDVILMDIRMETAKAGIWTAKKIQAQGLKTPKIIFLTSEYNRADIQKILSMNCSFVDKSCSVPSLITIIKRIVFKNRLIIDI